MSKRIDWKEQAGIYCNTIIKYSLCWFDKVFDDIYPSELYVIAKPTREQYERAKAYFEENY